MQLDSIEIYPKTVTHTITNDIYHTIKVKDKCRWELGLQVGYGIIGLLLFTLPFTTLNGYSQNKKKVESSMSIYTGERNRETDKVLIKNGD